MQVADAARRVLPDFQPSGFHTDDADGLRNGIRRVFPGTRLGECVVHFERNILTELLSVGDKELALEISKEFHELLKSGPDPRKSQQQATQEVNSALNNLMNKSATLKNFKKYYSTQWGSKVGDIYPSLRYYNTKGIVHTNHVESFNHKGKLFDLGEFYQAAAEYTE